MFAMPGSCGPGSTSALGLVTLTAPSAGSSGLPNEAAFAAEAAVSIAAPTAPVASILRRDKCVSINVLHQVATDNQNMMPEDIVRR